MLSLRLKIATVFFSIIVLSLVLLSSWSIKRAEDNLNSSYSLYLDTVLDRYLAESVVRMHSLLQKSGLEGIDSFVRDYQRRAIEAAGNLEMEEHVGIVILDGAGALVFASPGLDLSLGLDRLPALGSSVRGETQDGIRNHFHIRERAGWLYRGRYFEPWGWSVLLFLDHSLIHKGETEIRYATFGAVAVSLLISGFLILILLNRFLNKPILALKRAAEKVAQGEDVETIDVGNSDELGALARSMEAMSASIRDYREKQRQWQDLLEKQVRDRTADLEKVNQYLVDQIRERERTQKALEQSERLFRDLVENLPFPVVVSTAEMEMDYVNPRFGEVFGFGAAELPDREDWRGYLYPGRSRADREGEVGDVPPAVGEEGAVEGTLTTKSGRRVSVRSWVFRVGSAYYSVLEDISERRKAERERDIKNRLKGAMEMAGAACHELTQPLQVITAHLDLLKMREDKDPELERRIGIVFEQLEAIIGLISKIEGITRYEVKDYAGQTSILDIDRASRH